MVRFPSDEAARHAVVDLLVSRPTLWCYVAAFHCPDGWPLAKSISVAANL
jgi:hypothetical protein